MRIGYSIVKADSLVQFAPSDFNRNGVYYYESGSLGGRNSSGRYWESDLASTANARLLGFTTDSLDPQSQFHKGYGWSIRCLGRQFSSVLCWQLPTYNGTKSYQNLLVEVYGGVGSSLKNSRVGVITQNKPVNFILSGVYYHDSGTGRETALNDSTLWTKDSKVGRQQSQEFGATIQMLGATHDGTRGFGFSFRCLVPLGSLATPYLRWY